MLTSAQSETNCWQSFFDEDYIRIWSGMMPEKETAAQCDGLWALLQLREGSRVLDAGCGYGRLARLLAERGAVVLGLDQSAELLAYAERTRGDIPRSRLKYVRHDLRHSFSEAGFDAAFNVFTSIGFGTEHDDCSILTTLHAAVRKGGLVLLEAIQRDAVSAFMSRGGQQSMRLADGILVLGQSTYDPIASRITGTWYWSGAGTSGEKSATVHVYTVGELMRLVESVGLQIKGTYLGISTQPFQEVPPNMGGRVGILAQRPE
jgi:SAM-dependent methyltransferase